MVHHSSPKERLSLKLGGFESCTIKKERLICDGSSPEISACPLCQRGQCDWTHSAATQTIYERALGNPNSLARSGTLSHTAVGTAQLATWPLPLATSQERPSQRCHRPRRRRGFLTARNENSAGVFWSFCLDPSPESFIDGAGSQDAERSL